MKVTFHKEMDCVIPETKQLPHRVEKRAAWLSGKHRIAGGCCSFGEDRKLSYIPLRA